MGRELKEVRYVPQLKRNLISVGVLKVLGLKVSIRDGVLKITRGPMVILKGIRCNNLYYLNRSMVTGQVETSTNSDDDTRLWHMRLGYTGEKSLQSLATQDLLKAPRTYKLDFCEHCIIRKKTKVKFSTATHCTKGVLDYV